MATTAATSRLVSKPVKSWRSASILRASDVALTFAEDRWNNLLNLVVTAHAIVRASRVYARLPTGMSANHPTTIGWRNLVAYTNNFWLFANPGRTTNLSIDALADQTIDTRDFNMAWLVVNHT